MKEYLNQFAVITLACKGNGEILDRNAAAEKITWLPKVGEHFTHWSHTSNLQEMLCQTHYLQPSDQQALEASTSFRILPKFKHTAIGKVKRIIETKYLSIFIF